MARRHPQACSALLALLLLAACAGPAGLPPPPGTPPAQGAGHGALPAVVAVSPAALGANPGVVPPDLAAEVAALAARYEGLGVARVGLVIATGPPGEALELNPDAVFPAASLYKLFVLWAVQAEIRAGRLADETTLTLTAENDASADDGYALGPYGSAITVAEARRLMITVSNNTAAWALARRLGWAAIEGRLRANGFAMTETAARTVTTPGEVARFFRGLVDQTLDPALAPADYALMLDLLAAQEHNHGLPTGFPAGAVFAHKTGELDAAVHDAGVLLLPGERTVYLVVLTEGDYGASLAFMRELAAMVWRAVGPGAEGAD